MTHTPQAHSGLRVVVGVTGGIAAYKAVSLVRALVQEGHQVTVIPTASALKFVGLPTWQAISRSDVPVDLFEGVSEVTHVALGQRADLVIVAPATAHFLAQYANGMAGDLLGTTLLATEAPVVVAPAMHTEMWNHPATKANVELLRQRGVVMVGPNSGPLTGADRGIGRMAEPEEIIRAALSSVRSERPLSGKTVLVSAGGTREPIDPVRFLGNRSSGAMGVAIATEAHSRGARVLLVHAHLDVSLPRGMETVAVSTAEEMREAMRARQGEAHVVVMAAAVADYRPVSVSEQKLKKTEASETPQIALEETPDIAAELGAHKPEGQILVTFAAETEPDDEALLDLARSKGARKNSDLVVANRVGWQVGFGETEAAVWFVRPSGAPVLSTGSKMTVAGRLFDVLQH
ncbi:MAG: bifunctional phosphopantothenoylcysteine decarboxylase/phosphopantothenate--cysteine ligase CoaBC [Pontimonas sp.]